MKQKETINQILLDIRNLMMSRKRVLTVGELQSYTGMSRSHIYKLTMSKKIPHFKNPGGKLIFFRRSQIDEWLLSHEVPEF